ncbi:MAG: hypothetical protein JWN84_3501 [Nocardioides sp.]|nr:hypothetical protein [Nocardioides sp.]
MDVRDTYLAAWNETDREARDALLVAGWSASATYTDPMASARGLDHVSDVIGAVHGQFPGLVFAPIGDVDTHHDVARFRWGLGLPGEEPAAVGADVVTLDADGRIATVVGFLDRVPG